MPKLPPIDVGNATAQLRKGTLELAILLVVSRGPAYANDILAALRDADLLVVEGTVYPILNRLKTAGLLGYEWSESKSGPPRKYYEITPSGTQFLGQLSRAWASLDASMNTLMMKFVA